MYIMLVLNQSNNQSINCAHEQPAVACCWSVLSFL